MSTVSPAASSPSRRREGHWGYAYDYENSPHYHNTHGGPPRGPGGYYGGAPPSYGGPGHPPPPSHHHPSDYWSYEHGHRGNGPYWGPPPGYDNYVPHTASDRGLLTPLRGPRGPPRPITNEDQSPPPPHMRIPNSPRGGYGRSQISSQQKRGDFLPPQPPRGAFSKESGKEKKKGDPLSILANVSAGMTGKDGQKQQAPPEGRNPLPLPAPTSPLQRRSRPSPITPGQGSPENKQRSQRHQITPTGPGRSLEQHHSWDYGPEQGYVEHPPPPNYYPSRRRHPGYSDYSSRHPEPTPPALVERGSFDSQGDGSYRERPYPPSYYYDEQSYGYWEGGPPSFPPPRYNHHDWYENPEEGYGHHRPPPPVAPYTLVQQPRLEEKTILRKKFSWKHYPELERFLIANRDEYLKHSNMNYTAEQKQYNNWLTERLLEVAGEHNYVFDPDDFNFVAIRDRIRCYYKSYVQTARKRGLKLPEKKKD